jgi:hypothetical protein
MEIDMMVRLGHTAWCNPHQAVVAMISLARYHICYHFLVGPSVAALQMSLSGTMDSRQQ